MRRSIRSNPFFRFHSHASRAALAIAMTAVAVLGQAPGPGRWATLAQASLPIGREECSFAQAGGRFYLLGGRGVQPVQEFNPATRAWRNLKNTPVEMNHFQSVSVAGLVYVIGAFGGSYPHEVPVPNVYILDPLSDTWIKGPAIPAARLRGSAGLAEYQGRLYLALGIKDGHSTGWVPWLDEFDPATNAWKALPDAPRERDHFQAAVSDGRLYAIGGRRSSWKPDIFTDLEKVDVYDFAKGAAGTAGAWSTLASPGGDLKIKRSGSILAALGDEILVAGGGSNSNGSSAHAETDALNVKTHAWRSLAPLNRGRQVTGGFINNNAFYAASGSGGSGGSPVLQTMEAWFPGDSTAPSGAPLTAGSVGGSEAVFNFGMVASGQASTRGLGLKHVSGTQGVLVAGLKVVGDAAFKIKTQPEGVFLVRPGYPAPLEMTFASQGAAPAESHLEVTLAVPPGAVVKIPLDANRTPLPVLSGSKRRNFRSGPWIRQGGWLVGWDSEPRNLHGQLRGDAAPAPLPAP